MNEPLITCYTPTYNRSKMLLERAIPSVLNQTYTNIEYIIVSDGSTDNTKNVVKSFKDKRIRFFEIKRKHSHHNYNSEKQWCIGGSYASNFALKKAKGKWIARIDDDDIWTNDHIEKSLNFALENDYEFITSKGGNYTCSSCSIFKGVIIPPLLQDYLRIYDDLRENPYVGPHSSFFYRGYLKHIKYNTESYKKEWNRVEDPDLLEQIFNRRIKIGFLDKVLTYITPRPGLKNIGFKAIMENMKK